jgi:deazaflavin-dependent oxidoreductase (nitroreductase family)
MMYLVLTAIAVAVIVVLAAALLAVVYRVLKAAHTRPSRQGTRHSHDGASGGHVHAIGPYQHSRVETAVLTMVTRLIRLMIRRGVHLGPMMMLTVRGRKTGVARTNPVDVFERDGRRWLVATHDAGANWVRNLREAGEGTLALGRNSFSFTAAELPQDEAGRVLRDVLGPRLARPLAGFVLRQTLGVPPGAAPGEFERAAIDHPVFEITVTPDSRASQDPAEARVTEETA